MIMLRSGSAASPAASDIAAARRLPVKAIRFNSLKGLYLLLPSVMLATSACIAPTTQPVAFVEPVDGAWVTMPTDDYKGKRDDIVFANANVGFYGTGAGDLFKTVDGGANWKRVWSKPGTFIRALGFVDENRGFLGNVGNAYPNVTDKTPLYETTDGGITWTPANIGGANVEGICAIDILKTRVINQGRLEDRVVVHAAGRVQGPAKLLRSVDGGTSWSFIDLSDRAGMILDVKFVDPNTGFVFAGTSGDAAQSEALILKTTDGGKSWREVYRSGRKLENSWKASFLNARTGYATIQSYDANRDQQVVVKTVDGGETWVELPLVKDPKARQFGIGFATPTTGWVGTMVGGFETRDGGATWKPVRLAPAANKIRTRASDGTPLIYAIGTKVQRYLEASTVGSAPAVANHKAP